MTVVKFEKREGTKARIVVGFSAQEFEEALDAGYEKNKDQYPAKGIFRRVPTRAALEEKHGEKLFYEDAFEQLFPDGLDFASEELKISVVGQPAVSDFSVGEDKTALITYDVVLYPEMTMGQYKGIKAHKPVTSISEQQVDEELQTIRRRFARIQPAQREARMGDTAVIDFEGFIDGEAFEGGSDYNYGLELGSNTFIPGFEPQIAGMKVGEEKDIEVTFPEEYSNGLGGKAAVFHIKLRELRENILPELDDGFVKDVSDYSTVGEYRASIRKDLELKAEEDAENVFRSEVIEKVIDGMTGDIPDEMIDSRINDIIENYQNDFARRGMTFDQYLEYMDMDLNKFKQQIWPSALQQLKVDLAYETVAELEDFDVTEKEIEAKYAALGDEYLMDVSNVRDLIPRESVIKQIRIEKASELIFDTAIPE